MSKPIVNRLSKVQKAQSVHVQTDEVEDSPEAKAEGATVPVPVQSERT
jgi:stress response protein YsnF